MEEYIKRYDQFETNLIYDFKLGDGGIGDCIKFFMCILDSCMNSNQRLYYKKNNLDIEKYIKLKYDIMYIDEDAIASLDNVRIITPYELYSTVKYQYSVNIKDVFEFTDEVKMNRDKLILETMTNYISIHLRLGDMHLETDPNFVRCRNDTRHFSEEKICKFIEDNSDKNIFFCCDNNSYKLKLKGKYENIIITNCDIGHTSLSNTTTKQILDSITEFYILTNSDVIFSGSTSGFSIVASKFRNIPLIC